MIFLFTKSDLIGSKMIRWALDEPISHCAVVFDAAFDGKNHQGIVFHSHFGGVKFSWLKHFYTSNRTIFALRPKDDSLENEERVYRKIVDNFYGEDYDKKMFFEFSYYALRYKLTGKPIPQESKLGDGQSFLCTELAKKVADEYLSSPLPDGLISPYTLYKSMRECDKVFKAIDF